MDGWIETYHRWKGLSLLLEEKEGSLGKKTGREKKPFKKKKTQTHKESKEEIRAKQQSSDMRRAGKSQFHDGGEAERKKKN